MTNIKILVELYYTKGSNGLTVLRIDSSKNSAVAA
jgi:hypothetical protein